MRWKLVIGIIAFIIASIISFQFIPEYIGNKYYQKAMKLLYGEKKYEESISKFELARKLGPDKIKIISSTLIGFAYIDLKKYELAEKSFKEALQIAPHNNDAGRGLVESLIQLKRYDEAEKVALDRLTYLINDEDACLELTKIYALKKDFKKAKEYAEKCVELTDFKKSFDIMERVANRDLLMHVYCDLGEYENAIKTLNEILQLDPNFHGAYWNLAEVYEKLGNKEKALENWKKVVSFNDPPNVVELAKQRVQILEMELRQQSINVNPSPAKISPAS